MARMIGLDRREITNWTQDTMRTTRPIAEHMVAAMLDERIIMAGDSGFLLFEDDDELERRKSQTSFKLVAQKRIRFHAIRQHNKSRQTKARKIEYDYNNAMAAADQMGTVSAPEE